MDKKFGRRVGLNRNEKTQPLLRSLQKPKAQPPTDLKPQKRAPAFKNLESKEDIFAPPISSDLEDETDHDDEQFGLKSQKLSLPEQVDSSDSDQPPRGSIVSTKFTVGHRNGKQGRQVKDQGDDNSSATSRKKKKGVDESPQAAKKRQRLSASSQDQTIKTIFDPDGPDSSIPPSSSENHLQTSLGFTKKAKARVTYGKKFSSSQDSRKSKDDDAGTQFRPPPALDDSPQKRRNSKLLVPEEGQFSSPTKDKQPKRLITQHLKDVDSDDDPLSPIPKRTSKVPEAPLEDARKPRPSRKRKVNPLIPRKGSITGTKNQETSEPPSKSPTPPRTFKIPVQFSDLKRHDDTGPSAKEDLAVDLALSDSDELSSLGSQFDEEPEFDEDKAQTPCPWCGAAVETKLLQEFSKGKRLNVRMQTRFCQMHKKQTAIETWESRQYPQVQWKDLEERFKEHQNVLLSIINGGTSHYRSVLASKIESGQARSLRKEDNLNPGYYGPRGFNLMCDFLVKEFSILLKEKAVHDRVIAGRGSAAFIQAVLVPELGVQLIKQDMKVSAEEARDIMENSKIVGELVHAEN